MDFFYSRDRGEREDMVVVVLLDGLVDDGWVLGKTIAATGTQWLGGDCELKHCRRRIVTFCCRNTRLILPSYFSVCFYLPPSPLLKLLLPRPPPHSSRLYLWRNCYTPQRHGIRGCLLERGKTGAMSPTFSGSDPTPRDQLGALQPLTPARSVKKS